MGKYNTNELVEQIFQLSRFMKQEMSFTHNLIHLSILQIQTLIYLNQNKEVSMSDIANNFHIELPSATSLLNKLYDQNLVERQEDIKDRRLVVVKLTEKGNILLDEAMNERRKKLGKMLSYLSEKQRNDLVSILATLNQKLKEIQ